MVNNQPSRSVVDGLLIICARWVSGISDETCHGAALVEIADVLGHRSLDTTAIYAKVDLPSLAQVALPWPEATS